MGSWLAARLCFPEAQDSRHPHVSSRDSSRGSAVDFAGRPTSALGLLGLISLYCVLSHVAVQILGLSAAPGLEHCPGGSQVWGCPALCVWPDTRVSQARHMWLNSLPAPARPQLPPAWPGFAVPRFPPPHGHLSDCTPMCSGLRRVYNWVQTPAADKATALSSWHHLLVLHSCLPVHARVPPSGTRALEDAHGSLTPPGALGLSAHPSQTDSRADDQTPISEESRP